MQSEKKHKIITRKNNNKTSTGVHLCVSTQCSLPVPYFFRNVRNAEGIFFFLKQNCTGLAWGWGCCLFSLSLSSYCQDILTNTDCQGVKVTLLLNWERKFAGFGALCSAIPEFQKQEPGALYEGQGKSRRITRVMDQGRVPDKPLTRRWKNLIIMLCQEPTWLIRSSPKSWRGNSGHSLPGCEEIVNCLDSVLVFPILGMELGAFNILGKYCRGNHIPSWGNDVVFMLAVVQHVWLKFFLCCPHSYSHDNKECQGALTRDVTFLEPYT